MKLVTLLPIMFIVIWTSEAPATYKNFVVSPEVRQKYRENYKRLYVGIKKEKVITLMGKPHIDKILLTKQGKVKGSSLSYYVVRDHPELVNEKRDQVYIIFFGPAGNLINAIPKNIQGLSQIGQ